MIRDYQAVEHLVSPPAASGKSPLTGQHKGVKLIGTLDYETGTITSEGAYNDGLPPFSTDVQECPTGKIMMVLDNASIHHAKLIQPFLKEKTLGAWHSSSSLPTALS